MGKIYQAWKWEKNYQWLFWAGTVNGIGSRFTQVAVFALLYEITGSGMAIGFVLAIRMLPFLLLAPVGGMLADKFSKKRMLITIDLLRVPVVLSLLFVQGADQVWLVYTLSFLLAVGEACYGPARMSSIPILVKQERLIHINGIEQMMVGVILVLGSSTGGVISFFFGTHIPFLLNGITFLLSAMILLRMIIPMPNKLKTTQLQVGHEISLKKMFMSTALVSFFIIAITMPLANGIDNVLMSIYALDVFEMGDLGVGFIYASLGIGFIVSSFFSDYLKKGLLFLTTIFIAMEGVGHLLLSIAPSFTVTLLIVIFITFAGGISNICMDTIMMKTVPKSRQGTFFGLMATLSNTALGISMASAGFLLDIFSPRELSFLVGVAYIGLTLLYGFLFSRLKIVKEKRELYRKLS